MIFLTLCVGSLSEKTIFSDPKVNYTKIKQLGHKTPWNCTVFFFLIALKFNLSDLFQVEKAVHGEMKEWELEPKPSQALVLLTDQFTRSIYRVRWIIIMLTRRCLKLALQILKITQVLIRSLKAVTKELGVLNILR